MPFSGKFIRTEGQGRLRAARPVRAFDAGRQLETSIGAFIVMLMVGVVAMMSNHGQSAAQAHGVAAADIGPAAIVHTTVRVIPIFSRQAEEQVATDRRS